MCEIISSGTSHNMIIDISLITESEIILVYNQLLYNGKYIKFVCITYTYHPNLQNV